MAVLDVNTCKAGVELAETVVAIEDNCGQLFALGQPGLPASAGAPRHDIGVRARHHVTGAKAGPGRVVVPPIGQPNADVRQAFDAPGETGVQLGP